MNTQRSLLILFFFLPVLLFAQQKDTTAYQLSGLLISEGERDAIPFARVQINSSRSGVMSNTDGFYSVPVRATDTLFFNHMGYYPSQLIIADYLKEYKVKGTPYLYAITYLREDTFMLPVVKIFPYNTPEELRSAVVNMDFPTDGAAVYAKENLDPELIHAIMQTLPVDSDERLIVGRQMYYNYYLNKNLAQTASIDPLAAARLLQYIANKAEKRKNKDLNYWE
jgi:hypothetical protein